MLDDCEDLRCYMQLPETNEACFAALVTEAMADIEYGATMKVINVIMADKES